MGHINSIEINRFRGIKQLEITDFSNINLIVGDNNSGKTTFLEAIQLLFAKTQLGSIKKIINQRSVLSPDRSSFYVSFIKMFDIEQPADQLEFDIYAKSSNGILRFQLSGQEKSISGDEALQLSALSPREKMQYKRSSAFLPETAKVFIGTIFSQTNKKGATQNIRCTSMDT